MTLQEEFDAANDSNFKNRILASFVKRALQIIISLNKRQGDYIRVARLCRHAINLDTRSVAAVARLAAASGLDNQALDAEIESFTDDNFRNLSVLYDPDIELALSGIRV